MELELSPDEVTVLREIMQRQLGDTREEAYKTESYDYKRLVKAREATIAAILQKLDS